MRKLLPRRLPPRAYTAIEVIVTLVIILLLSLLLIPQFTGQANDAADSQARASAQAALSSAAVLYQVSGELPDASALFAQDPDVSFVPTSADTNPVSAAASTVSVDVSSDGTVFAAAVQGGGTNCWMVQWNTDDTENQTPTIYAKESTATGGFNCEANYALQISQCPQASADNGDSWTTPLICKFDSSSTSTALSGSTTTTTPSTTLLEDIAVPTPELIENTYASSATTMSWSWPASTGGTGTENYHWSLSPTAGSTCASGVTTATELTCTNVLSPGTTYTFSVYAVDSLNNTSPVGQVTATASAVVTSTGVTTTARPASLSNPDPSITSNVYGSMTWSWPTSTGGNGTTTYHWQLSPWTNECTNGSTTATGFTCASVTPGTVYTFSLYAQDTAGDDSSVVSITATATTTKDALLSTPTPTLTNNSTPFTGLGSMTWVWPASTGSTSSVVYYWSLSPQVASCANGFTEATTLTCSGDLTPGTTYTFAVYAQDPSGDASGVGTISAIQNGPATVPDAPTGVSAASDSSTQSPISWNAPDSDGGATVSAYVIEYATSPYNNWTAASTEPSTCTNTFCTATGLANGTNYEFRVAAINRVGTGAYSTASLPATPASVPGVPTALSCTSDANTSSVVSWSTPASSGGATITGYSVQFSSDGGATWTSASTSATSPITLTGLTNGTNYECEAAATNAAGTGSFTSPVSFTPATTPSAPTNPLAAPGNNQVTLEWSAPASNGGAAIAGYSVSTTGGSCSTLGALTCTVTGLTNGDSYTFSVTATNTAGTGPSATVTAIPATVPSAPTGLIATPGTSDVVLSWSTPSSNGGEPITGYSVLEATSPFSSWTVASTSPSTCTSTTCTATGLSNGTSYEFEVEAVNLIGNGPASSPSSAETPEGAPSAPTGVTGSSGNAQVTVLWSMPSSDGGSSITNYTVTSSPGALTCTTSGALDCLVLGLTNGTSYTFTVTATNAAGFTSPVSMPSLAVVPSTVPSAPTDFVATPNENSEVPLTWSPPSSNGGAAVAGYTVTSTPTSSGCSTTSTNCVISGLTNGTTYSFSVVANNVAGSSAPASASATPCTVPTAPNSPSAHDQAPDTSSADLVVSWSAPSTNGGSVITLYTAIASPSGLSCTSSSATSCEITGLSYSTTYTVYVSATNAAGTGASSSTTQTTNAQAPSTPSVGVYSNSGGVVQFEFSSATGTGPVTFTLSGCESGTVSGTAGTTYYESCGSTSDQGDSFTLNVTASNSAGTSAPGSDTATANYALPVSACASVSTFSWYGGTAPASTSGSSAALNVAWSDPCDYGIDIIHFASYTGSGCSTLFHQSAYTAPGNIQGGTVNDILSGTYDKGAEYSIGITLVGNPEGATSQNVSYGCDSFTAG